MKLNLGGVEPTWTERTDPKRDRRRSKGKGIVRAIEMDSWLIKVEIVRRCRAE